MLWAVFIALLALWAFGFIALHIGGALIHLLLVIAAIVLIYQFMAGRRVG